jgi:hypothetical protein
MGTRKKILAILLVGLGLYIASALLTFSWKEKIPEARIGSEGLSFSCTHPFGFPIKDSHKIQSNCMPDRDIIRAQFVNLGAWIAVAILSYFLYRKYKKIQPKNSWAGKLKVFSLFLIYAGLSVVIYFLAHLIFFVVPPLLSQQDDDQRILIQTR